MRQRYRLKNFLAVDGDTGNVTMDGANGGENPAVSESSQESLDASSRGMNSKDISPRNSNEALCIVASFLESCPNRNRRRFIGAHEI